VTEKKKEENKSSSTGSCLASGCSLSSEAGKEGEEDGPQRTKKETGKACVNELTEGKPSPKQKKKGKKKAFLQKKKTKT